MRKSGLIVLAALFVFVMVSEVTASDGIKWYPYGDGFELGKDKSKKIYINFFSDWCSYCRMMNEKTFKDKDVISYLNDNYIAIRVNSEKEPELANQYKVNGLPSNWFVTEEGEPIGNQPGYVGPDDMLKLLKYIKTDSYKKMPFSQFDK